jgi:hypothetical protein
MRHQIALMARARSCTIDSNTPCTVRTWGRTYVLRASSRYYYYRAVARRENWKACLKRRGPRRVSQRAVQRFRQISVVCPGCTPRTHTVL